MNSNYLARRGEPLSNVPMLLVFRRLLLAGFRSALMRAMTFATTHPGWLGSSLGHVTSWLGGRTRNVIVTSGITGICMGREVE